MRRYGSSIVLLSLFILWLVLVAYLAGLPPEQRGLPRINVGIVPVVKPPGPDSVSLTEAALLARSYQFIPVDEPMDKEFFYILGMNVDKVGNASSWVFGIRHNNATYLLTYDRAGWENIRWNGTFPERELDINRTVPLDRVFQDNQDLLVQAALPERRVELIDTSYYISLSNKTTSRSYTFDAVTGALIQSHEE
jgi:hypothetical protein